MVLCMGGKYSGLLGKNQNVLREQSPREHKSGPGLMPQIGIQVTETKPTAVTKIWSGFKGSQVKTTENTSEWR